MYTCSSIEDLDPSDSSIYNMMYVVLFVAMFRISSWSDIV